MSPHRIRLPAPWRVTGSVQAAPAAESSVVFRRSFQRPTGLSDQSIIALEIALFEPLPLSVSLNGNACPLERRSDVVFAAPLSADQLQPVNELAITVRVPPSAKVIEHPKFGQDYISRVELVLS